MFSFVPTVFAQETINLGPTGAFANLSTASVEKIISAAISFALIAAAIVFFLMLIIGGIKWMMSGGDKAQTESARNQVTAALVGLVIVFAAWAIANLLQTFFGISIFTSLKFPTISAPGVGQ